MVLKTQFIAKESTEIIQDTAGWSREREVGKTDAWICLTSSAEILAAFLHGIRGTSDLQQGLAF